MERVFGANKAKKDIREYSACLTQVGLETIYPDEFELTMPDVKNQLNVSSCVAHAIAIVVEYFNQQQEKDNKRFSTAFIYGNRRNMNNLPGMFVDVALNNVVKLGDVYREDMDGNYEVPKAIELFEEQALELAAKAYPHRFTSFYRLNSTNEMKAQLMTHGPIVFSIPWYSDYYVEAKTYVMKHFNNYVEGYHAMVIYGWNKDGWKIQNSWGVTFGNRGRAVLPYGTYMDTCFGVTDEIINSTDVDEKVKQLQEEIAKYKTEISQKENELNEIKNKYNDLYNKYKDKDAQIKEIHSQLNELEEQYNNIVQEQGDKSKAAINLKKKIDTQKLALEVLESEAMQVLNKIIEINNSQFELQEKLIELSKIIEQQRQEIDNLTNQLLDIEKPFKKMPKWLAELINAIINLFKGGE